MLYPEVTINDLVNYVKQHPKRDAVWRGWTDTQLATAIHEAYRQTALSWCHAEDGKICGVVVGKPNYETRTLHIIGIHCDDAKVLGQFLKRYIQIFGPLWTLTGTRNGKLKQFKLRHLCSTATSQIR